MFCICILLSFKSLFSIIKELGAKDLRMPEKVRMGLKKTFIHGVVP